MNKVESRKGKRTHDTKCAKNRGIGAEKIDVPRWLLKHCGNEGFTGCDTKKRGDLQI